MGRFCDKYFLILCIIQASLAASHFRVEKYTVTFDEDLDSENLGDANNAIRMSSFDVPQSTGYNSAEQEVLSKMFGQLIRPIGDATPFPKGKLHRNPEWSQEADGEIGSFAYSAGYLHRDNFVARVAYNNSLIPGKIVAGQNEAYIGVGTKGIGFSSYETLQSSPSNLCWTVPAFLSTAKPMEGGHDENGNPIYIGRTIDEEILGAFYPSRGELVTTSDGHSIIEKNLKNIQILAWSWSVYPNCGW